MRGPPKVDAKYQNVRIAARKLLLVNGAKQLDVGVDGKLLFHYKAQKGEDRDSVFQEERAFRSRLHQVKLLSDVDLDAKEQDDLKLQETPYAVVLRVVEARSIAIKIAFGVEKHRQQMYGGKRQSIETA